VKKLLSLAAILFLIPLSVIAEEKFCDENGHCYTKKGDSSQWYDSLVEKGLVTVGKQPETNKLDTVVKGLEKFQKEQQEKEDRELSKKQEAVNLYKKLVDAGYTPMQAWESALKNLGFPPPENPKK
jgi:hypothetical protein